MRVVPATAAPAPAVSAISAVQTRVGVSGWTYPHWRGKFYPPGLPHRRELEYVASRMNSAEINGSFYSLQRPESYAAWHAQTPADFVFAVKGGRFITHMKKLREVRQPLANFFASGLLRLGEKLGPILWQFPPGLGFDAGRFEAFFALLPRDTETAAVLAREHGPRLAGRAWAETDARRPVRYAVEIRHGSFLDAAFVDLLRRHGLALVFADTAGRWPYAEDLTADFVYARLHGDTELYASGYGAPALDWWAARLAAWRRGDEPADARRVGPALLTPADATSLADRATPADPVVAVGPRPARDVYVYFDNDARGHAPADAIALAGRMRA